MAEIWRGTWVVAYREMLRFVTERSRIVSSLAFPLLFLVIFGAGFGQTIGTLAPGVSYIQFMYPGLVAMTVLTQLAVRRRISRVGSRVRVPARDPRGANRPYRDRGRQGRRRDRHRLAPGGADAGSGADPGRDR